MDEFGSDVRNNNEFVFTILQIVTQKRSIWCDHFSRIDKHVPKFSKHMKLSNLSDQIMTL